MCNLHISSAAEVSLGAGKGCCSTFQNRADDDLVISTTATCHPSWHRDDGVAHRLVSTFSKCHLDLGDKILLQRLP